MIKIGIIATSDAETVCDTFRFIQIALESGHEVMTFLLGEGGEKIGEQKEGYNTLGGSSSHVERAWRRGWRGSGTTATSPR